MAIVTKENEVSLPENLFFYDEAVSPSTTGVHCGAKRTRVPFTQQCKENRRLLTDQNKNIFTTDEKQCSNLDGIKGVLSSKDHQECRNAIHSSSFSISTKSRRLVTKDGIVDVKYTNIPGISSRYLNDLFHTLIDSKWRYISVLFTCSFILSWLLFGTSWYAIVEYRHNETCIDNVDDWVSAFLFSIETQTTIGFGGRAVTSSCPEAVLLLVVQTIVGMFINCAMLGLLFAKLARPKNRGKSTMFSKKAVLTIREGNYCLIFRYVDFRHRRLLDSNMRMVIVRQKLTEEGEFIPLDMADLQLTIDYNQIEYTLRLFPLFPVTVIHVINENSPLYKMSKCQLEQADFEIIPILEGTVPTTGSTTQALTSYRPSEILWGHRFKPVFNGTHIGQAINRINISTLHDTFEEKQTPVCSAEDYHHNKENDDFSSFCGSHGYQSGTRSNYSIDHRAMSHPDVSKVSTRDRADTVIDMNTENIRNITYLKETDA